MEPRIKELRLKKGLRQDYCAKEADMSQQLWSAFENGKKIPRLDRALKMAKVLNVDVNELYEE